MTYLIGADPEVFLSVGSEFISAHGLFPGTKSDPYKVEKGAVQVDGTALEFNIDPASSVEEFDGNIQTVLMQMEEMVKDVDKDIKINFRPVARFNKEKFKEFPEVCKILGCDPDFNTQSGQPNNPPNIKDEPFRTAAGHVHIGWTKDEDPMSPIHFQDCLAVARKFNNTKPQFLGSKTPEEIFRERFYGAGMSFRPKSYGVELRGYSNRWVADSSTRKEMFNFVQKTMKSMEN